MTEELLRIERVFWRYGAIRLDPDGRRHLLTDKVPGPLLVTYRLNGGAL